MNESILVVEDENIVAKDISTRLQHLGYSVPGVASFGEDAIFKAQALRPDLALVDVRLRGAMDGIEVAGFLREKLGIPVIFLTAYADDATLDRAKKTEPFGYLIKPFEERELQTAVELALYKHRIETRLRDSEQWLSATLRCIDDAVLATDEKGLVRFMNPVSERLTEWSQPEALGRGVTEVLSFVDSLTIENPVLCALEGQPAGESELVLRSRSGRRIPVEHSTAPIRNPGGRIIGAVVAFRDITERKQVSEALRASEERYRELFENANDAVYTTDLDGKLTSVNKAAEKLTGYARDEAIGMNIVDVVAPEDKPLIKQMIDRKLGGESRINYELSLLAKDGRRVAIETATRLQFSDGRPVGIHGIARDITERRRAAELLAKQARDLARSNAELEQFAYVASHDLQKPLRMVASYVQLLAQRYRGKLDADADEFIGYALDGATRMQQLIKDLLAYSRVGTRGREFEQVDCEAVLEQAMHNLMPRIQETGATVTHGPLPSVDADRMQLGQLFQNLLSNALKFHAAAAPSVHISAEKTEAEWIFSVRDNGIGVHPESAARIFNIFERAHADYPGTGIGLAICKRIAERHGGRIWVESDGCNGSTFKFTLPLERTRPE